MRYLGFKRSAQEHSMELDHKQAALRRLEEAGEHARAYAGDIDIDRLHQFLSHLETCKMVVNELHGTQE
jgi:hypothetical protein